MELLNKNEIYDASIDINLNDENIKNTIDRDRTMVMIVSYFLSAFAQSEEYVKWCQNIETKQDYLCQSLRRLMYHEKFSNEGVEKFAKRDEYESKGLDYVHFKCVDDICESYYLYNFIGTVEHLPIGMTLSQVVRDTKEGITDFVIIYANEVYSWMTGYIRKEIVGRKFLDFNREMNRDIDKRNQFVSDKLRQSNTLAIKLNNYCKNGEPFQQILGTKPIFDSNGTYAYVVGIHIDVTIEYGLFWSDKLMANLLSKLPDRLSTLELQHVSTKYTCRD